LSNRFRSIDKYQISVHDVKSYRPTVHSSCARTSAWISRPNRVNTSNDSYDIYWYHTHTNWIKLW